MGEMRRVDQPVKEGELAVLVALHHSLKVELQVGGLEEAGSIPEKTQDQAVAYEPPQGV